MTNTKVMASSVRNRQVLEERRRKAMRWYDKGWTQYHIAKTLKVSFEAVSNWVEAYEKRGNAGLKTLGKPGPKSRLTEKNKQKIKAAILKGPEAYGYDTGLWTLERLATVIRRIAKLSFKTTHTWRIVVSLGFSCQKPERRARERDEEKIKRWRLKIFPPPHAMGKNA